MSEHVLEEIVNKHDGAEPGRRHKHHIEETLLLTALDSSAVLDPSGFDDGPLELVTCGSVRETCPKCRNSHLQLILRQRQVRLPHLFCGECLACFDAHYKNGASALEI